MGVRNERPVEDAKGDLVWIAGVELQVHGLPAAVVRVLASVLLNQLAKIAQVGHVAVAHSSGVLKLGGVERCAEQGLSSLCSGHHRDAALRVLAVRGSRVHKLLVALVHQLVSEL